MHFKIPLALAALSCNVLAKPIVLQKRGENCLPAGFHLETVTQTIVVKDGTSAPGAVVLSAAGSSGSSGDIVVSGSSSSSSSGANGANGSNGSNGASSGPHGLTSDDGSNNNGAGGSSNGGAPNGVAPNGVAPNGVAPNVVVATVTTIATLTSTVRPNGFNGTASTRTTTEVITTVITTTIPVTTTTVTRSGSALPTAMSTKSGLNSTTSATSTRSGTALATGTSTSATQSKSSSTASSVSSSTSATATASSVSSLSSASSTATGSSSSAASSSATSTTPSGPISTDTGSINDPRFRAAVLSAHNMHRSNHSAPDLVWDEQLAAKAFATSSTCVFAHTNAGQNLAAGGFADVTAVVHDGWYNSEMPKYNSYGGEPDNLNDVGHFTQVVWHDAKKVGCAQVNCNNSVNGDPPLGEFWTCNYDAGNLIGSFAKNVLKPEGHPVVTGSTLNQ